MNKLSTLRLASVVVPLVSAIIALVIVVLQVQRLHNFEEGRAQTIRQMSLLEKQIHDMKNQPQQPKVAVLDQVSNEQSQFLEMIRGFAINSRVQLVKYENKPTPPPPLSSADAKAGLKPTGLPPGVIALTGSVEVAGDYQELRQFMYRLLRATRLYNTTDLKWIRQQQQRSKQEIVPPTHLSFTLTRYVYAPGGAAPVPPHSS